MKQHHEFDFTAHRDSYEHRIFHNGREVYCAQHGFRFSDAVGADVSLRALLPVEKDVRDVVLAIYLADCHSSRALHKGSDRSETFWGRRITIRLALREPERWTPRVLDLLGQQLHFVAGDHVELEVEDRSEDAEQSGGQLILLDADAIEKRRRQNFRRRHWRVALSSEGFDSWAGLRDHMAREEDTHWVLATYVSNPRVHNLHSLLLHNMPPQARARVHPLQFRLQQNAGTVSTGAAHAANEMSLRMRGLLFLTGGALAARNVGLDKLYLFENGLGAFNFDFDASQLPGQATRAVHPLALSLFSQWISEVLRERFQVVNPYLFHTKAQMCRALDTDGWRSLIADTFTCGHEYRLPGARWHCGACTSCLLRRWSLRAANLWREDTPRYFHDFARPESVPIKHRLEWLKTQEQLRHIEGCLAAGGDSGIWRALQRRWPDLARTQRELVAVGTMSASDFERGLVRLLRAHSHDGLAIAPASLQSLPQILPVQKPAATPSLFGDWSAGAARLRAA